MVGATPNLQAGELNCPQGYIDEFENGSHFWRHF